MPTYDYQCQTCSHIFEHFQGINDDLLTTCPECGKTLKRLIGGGLGVIFKGSGFYVNDSKSKSSAINNNSSPVSKTKSSSESKPGAKGSSVSTADK